LHAADINIIVHYRSSRQNALNLKQELESARPASVELIKADLKDIKNTQNLLQQAAGIWGRLDVLVNNASNFYPTPIGKIKASDWDDLLTVNLQAPLFLAQAAHKYLQKTSGVIVNITDIYGLSPLANHTVYSITKSGLIMLTKSLAHELGPEVRVNAVAPGAILWPEHGLSDKAKQDILQDTPLKRVGSPADIAKAVRYLVQDAIYTTGQVLAVDGGRTI